MEKDNGIFSSYTPKHWILTILGAFLFGLTLDGCKHLPSSVNFFFRIHQAGLSFFFWAFVIIAVFTGLIYLRSLGLFEEDTEETLKSKDLRIAIWIVFWLNWSFYCSYLFISQIPRSKSILILITVLAIMPGLFMFLLSYYIRKEEIIQNEEIRLESEKNNHTYTPYNLGTKIKDYAGSYGLICIPAYLLFLAQMALMLLK